MSNKNANWPADAVQRIPTAALIPYARNARTHSDEQIAQIAASIREWGWTVPVLVDEHGGVIAGHGRLLAAQRLGIEEVPAMVANGWTEAQKRAYVLADNQLALNAGWDSDLLKVELGDLHGMDFDLNLVGFDAVELERIMFEPDFAPGTEHEQGKLDELKPKIVRCPHCGEEFDSREQE